MIVESDSANCYLLVTTGSQEQWCPVLHGRHAIPQMESSLRKDAQEQQGGQTNANDDNVPEEMGPRTRQWRWCKPSTLAMNPPPCSGDTLTWEGLIPDSSAYASETTLGRSVICKSASFLQRQGIPGKGQRALTARGLALTINAQALPSCVHFGTCLTPKDALTQERPVESGSRKSYGP